MKKYRTKDVPYIEINIGDNITIVKEETSEFGGKRTVTEKVKVTEKNIQALVDASILTEIIEEKPEELLISLIKECAQQLKKSNPILSYINISNMLKALYDVDKGTIVKLVLKQYTNRVNKGGIPEGCVQPWAYNQNWRYGLNINGDINIYSLGEIKTFETASYFKTIKDVTIAQKLFQEILSTPRFHQIIAKAFDKLIDDDFKE